MPKRQLSSSFNSSTARIAPSSSSKMIDAVGAQLYADKLSRLADEHGDHFAPAQLLLDHAKAGTKIHP